MGEPPAEVVSQARVDSGSAIVYCPALCFGAPIGGHVVLADRVDRLIAAEAGMVSGPLAVVDAPGLVGAALSCDVPVRVWCDDARDAATVPTELLVTDPMQACAGAAQIWLRLPKSLGALEEYAGLTAAHGGNNVEFFAGARENHLNRSMNAVLARYFGEVSASLGVDKARVLHARAPRRGLPVPWPRANRHPDLGVTLWGHGATFATTKVDAGSRLLASTLLATGGSTGWSGCGAEADRAGKERTQKGRVLDLGCGNGLLGVAIAIAHPECEVHGLDVSWAATDATIRTAQANGVRVQTHWLPSLSALLAAQPEFDATQQPDGGFDLIVCNPPFHQGVAKDSGPTFEMFAAAARALTPGGQFWCVFNSHLPWRGQLARLIGPTGVVAQDRRYTLTRSVSRAE